MEAQERWLYAVALVLVDVVAIVVPLTALCTAYVLVVRPARFRGWVEKIYAVPPSR